MSNVEVQNISTNKFMKSNFGAKAVPGEKKVYLVFDGFFTNDCAMKFGAEYAAAKGSVKVSESELLIDSLNMKSFPVDAVDAAGAIFKDYCSFKSIKLILPKDILANKQILKILKDNGIESRFEVVKSF